MATRSELFSKLGYSKNIVEPILDAVHKKEEEQIWREDMFSSPHGQHWHLSFHASSFPGDDEKACGRKAIYSLMNIPSVKPINRSGRAVMEAGNAIEDIIVWRLYRSGLLLTDPPDADHQMGFEDKEHWLTGSPDAIIKHPSKNYPHPVEVKSKDGEVVEQMEGGARSFDPPHRSQALTYIGLTKIYQENLWSALEETTSGSLIYASRNRPDRTHEYKFEHDQNFMDRGFEKLKLWQSSYLEEELPQRDKSWRWTEQPCKWCVSPDTKILTEDLQWIEAKDIDVKTKLLAFKDNKYEESIVEAKEKLFKRRLRITTDKVSTLVSDDHKFLVRTTNQREWREAKNLKPGDKIIYFGSLPWDSNLLDRDAGWLAGIFDGEGLLCKDHLTVAQNEGPILENIKILLKKFGFDFGIQLQASGKTSLGKNICTRIRINGGTSERLRFLAQIRPKKFYEKRRVLWENKSTWSKNSDWAIVQLIEDCGTGEVIALQTSTETLITDSLFSHNCPIKPICKQDTKDNVTKLKNSNALKHAEEVRGSYDYNETREAVLTRWNVEGV